MNVIKKTSSGMQSLSLDAVLLDRRMVFLNGDIRLEDSSTDSELMQELELKFEQLFGSSDAD